VTSTYHDLSATERDALLAAATATSTTGGRPNKADVYRSFGDMQRSSITAPSLYKAIDRLADEGLLRVSPIDDRAQGVTVTPAGDHVLHDAADRLRKATDGDYSEDYNA